MELQTTDIILHKPEADNTGFTGELQFSKITVNEDYLKKWNENMQDFICLTRNGQLISNSLYRKGGMGGEFRDGYMMLLKYVEAIYDFDFIKQCYPNKGNKELELQRRHLEGRWCIIDKNGVEKVAFKQFANPYLTAGQVYSLDNKYYNIETGELYCRSYTRMESEEFIFLDNAYDDDHSKRGIMKINKKDGSYELFPKK